MQNNISRLVFFNSVLRPFQDYFRSYETSQLVGGAKTREPRKNHLAHPQAELVARGYFSITVVGKYTYHHNYGCSLMFSLMIWKIKVKINLLKIKNKDKDKEALFNVAFLTDNISS